MQAYQLWRWPNINSELVQRIVFDVGSCTRRSQTALDADWSTALIYLQPQDI